MTDVGNGPKCACLFYERAPMAHDRLLGIENEAVPCALEFVASLISNDDLCNGDTAGLIDDPGEFTRFVGRHNWQDPLGMFQMAEAADFAVGQAWASRAEKERSRAA